MKFLVVFCMLFFVAAASPAATFDELSTRAAAARDANRISEAIELYRQALELNPKWQEGLWFLGTFLYQKGDYAGAQKAFGRFVTLAPQAGPAWGLLALAEFRTGAYDSALEHLERSLDLKAGEQEGIGFILRYQHAQLLTRAGAFEQALRAFRPFLQSGSADPSLLAAVGLAALHRPRLVGDVPAAELELLQAAGKATALTMSGRTDEARASFADLLKRFGGSPDIHYLYGCFLFPTSPDEAIAEMKRELAISPNHPGASAMIAWSLLVDADPGAALPHAQIAAAGEQKSATAQYVMGRSLHETGRSKEGLPYLEAAASLDASNWENRVALVTAYAKLGRYADAKRERANALRLSAEAAGIAQR